MEPAIKRFLQEGADLLNQDCNAVDRLMQYLDENLVMLHSQLNSENFDRILSIMWDNVSNVLTILVESSLEVSSLYPSVLFESRFQITKKIFVFTFRSANHHHFLQTYMKH